VKIQVSGEGEGLDLAIRVASLEPQRLVDVHPRGQSLQQDGLDKVDGDVGGRADEVVDFFHQLGDLVRVLQLGQADQFVDGNVERKCRGLDKGIRQLTHPLGRRRLS
jgi:hypothetical protein